MQKENTTIVENPIQFFAAMVLAMLVLLLTACGGNSTSPVPAKSWSHPVDMDDHISPLSTGPAYGCQVAMNELGNAMIVWTQPDSTSYPRERIFMSQYDSDTWSHPADGNDHLSPDGSNADLAQATLDPSGNAIVVWRQFDVDDYWNQIFMSQFRNGIWDHPSDWSDNISPDGQHADNPQVGMDANGNAIVVWRQANGAGNAQVYMSLYRNSVWSHPTDLADNISPDGSDVYTPQVAMSANGDAVVVWSQRDGAYSQIFMSQFRNGIWSHPTGLDDNISPDGRHATYPTVAMDTLGNAVVAWGQSDGTARQAYVSQYRNGTWTHPTSLDDNISPDGYSVNAPQVAMDADGDAIVVWDQANALSEQIYMSEYRGGVWTHPADLDDYISLGSPPAFDQQVAMDADGNAIVIWCQTDGTNDQIFMSQYLDGAWTHPGGYDDNISPDGVDAHTPQVAMDASGNGVVVWEQSYRIFMSEYR